MSIKYTELRHQDPAVYRAIRGETNRQKKTIELIASENFVSPAVLEAVGSVLTNKYAEGYPSHRYYGGCKYVDQVEEIAIDRLKKLFGCEHANVQPHSWYRWPVPIPACPASDASRKAACPGR